VNEFYIWLARWRRFASLHPDNYATDRQQPENDEQNVSLAPTGEFSADAHVPIRKLSHMRKL